MPRTTLPRAPTLLLAIFAISGCGGQCDRAWYADLDGDGFGDRADLVRACEAPRAYVDNPADCDDAESQVNPDALEWCNGRDDDCDGEIDPDLSTWYADADDDGFGTTVLTIEACAPPEGYVDRAGDCDDSEPTIRPEGADEICDGRDQDCDGLVDEGAPGIDEYFPDDDFDGQGDSERGETWCVRPAGWVLLGVDCDDDDSSVYVGALEACNGHDDDCDGLVDDDDPGVIDGLPWYEDQDGDGWGTGEPEYACEWPGDGWTSSPGDCDDGEILANPWGGEVCGGGDEDCDTLIDEEDPSVAPSTLVQGWVDADGDGLGDPDQGVEACELAFGVVGNATDCDDGDRFVGTDWWVPDLDGDGAGAGTPVAGAGCAPSDPSWVNAAAGGDCDDLDPAVRPRVPDACGDGVDQDCSGVDPVCRAPLAGLVGLDEAGRAWVTGLSAADAIGSAVGPAGDLDGDGLSDAALGAPGAGEVRILLGPPPEVPGAWAASRVVSGPGLGGVVAIVPDTSGDARAEIVVGAPDQGGGAVHVLDDGGLSGGVDGARATIVGGGTDRLGAAVVHHESGELFVGMPGANGGGGEVGRFPLSWVGFFGPNDAEFTATGSGGLGSALSVGDLDGDGAGDLAVGAPGLSAAYVLPTSWNGVWIATSIDLATVNAPLGTDFGAALDLTGDLDGDGLADLAAAAPEDPTAGLGAGRAFVFSQPAGALGVASALFTVDGDAAGAGLAQSVTSADLDGDGADDLLLGVTSADLAGADGGAVYVFPGPVAGLVQAADAEVILFGASGDAAGAALAVTDLDGDGWDDLWVGAPGSGSGAAWWIPGAY